MPPATGKLSIWTAKMKAATRPAIGACRSLRTSAVLRTQTVRAPTVAIPAPTETPVLMNPSGMCTRYLSGAGRRSWMLPLSEPRCLLVATA